MPSFHASYRCGRCKHKFKALIDVDVHREAIAARRPPTLTCPSCGERAAAFDGDRDGFARQAAQVAAEGGPAPARRDGGDADQPQLSRHNEGDTTRLVLVGEMTTGVRWRSAMDDLGGEVVVDLRRVSNVSGGGVSPLVTALRAAPKSVRGMVVLGCPLALAEAVRAKPIPNLRIGSVVVEGHCPGCRQARRGLIELGADKFEDALRRDVPCTICGKPLVRAGNAADLPHRTLPFGMILGVAGVLAIIGLGVVLVGIVLAGIGELSARLGGNDMPADNGAEQRLQLGDDRVTARGHGGPYGTAAEAEAAARDKALGVLISALAKQISERRGMSAGSVEVPPSAVAKFVAAVEINVDSMLVSSEVTEGEGGFEVDAAYALDRARFDAIVGEYAVEREWGPLKLVRPFPPSPGLRVVKSGLDGVQAGTRVVEVGEAAVHELDQLPDPVSGLTVVLQDTDGKERTVSLP